jgi:4-hydroxy-4-methyl-2-oxoglutarate aldolase
MTADRHVVVQNVRRAAPDAVAALTRFGVATVHEAQGRRGLMQPWMRPVWTGARAGGTAVTVLAPPGDNWMIHVAVEVCRPGDLLVVATTSDNTDAMLGELLATSLAARGVTGAVLDAGCRDVAGLREMGFPVWARAISAQGTVKATLGAVNVPLVCAGAVVEPGDAVIADDDGVVVVARQRVAEVVAAGAAREAKEAETRKRLAAGELGLDVYGMRGKLEALGLCYLDGPGDEDGDT